MSHLSDPLTLVSFALIASFAVGLLFTGGRRRVASEARNPERAPSRR